MLRFLVDLRGEEVDNTQMRDDLITLLIAGHETTAAVLTWMTYALSQHPEALKTVQAEIDAGDAQCFGCTPDVFTTPGSLCKSNCLTPCEVRVQARLERPAGEVLVHEALFVALGGVPQQPHEARVPQPGEHLELRQELPLPLATAALEALDGDAAEAC